MKGCNSDIAQRIWLAQPQGVRFSIEHPLIPLQLVVWAKQQPEVLERLCQPECLQEIAVPRGGVPYILTQHNMPCCYKRQTVLEILAGLKFVP